MRDVAIRPIVRVAAVIALVVALVAAAVLALLHSVGIAPGGERFEVSYSATLRAPGLSSAPQPEQQRERQDKESRLHSAGWVDRSAGLVHIPIEDALDLLASRAEGRR
jgi:hypothetical protein